MIIRCMGTWTDEEHEPVSMGQKEPIADTSFTHGICDRCCKVMNLKMACRWCLKSETTNGLCGLCETILSRQIGEPTAKLTVYRAGAEPLSGKYDGSGAVFRLLGAMKEPQYCGFNLQPLVEAVR